MFRCYFSTSWLEQRLPHSTGVWHILRNKAEDKFEDLKGRSKYKFVENLGNGKKGVELGDEVQFNVWLEDVTAGNNKPTVCLSIIDEGRSMNRNIVWNNPREKYLTFFPFLEYRTEVIQRVEFWRHHQSYHGG